MSSRNSWVTRVALFLAILFAIGVAIALVFGSLASSQDDLFSSVAKAGIAIAATTVAGAVATGAFKLVDEQRLRDQERRKIFYEIVRAYNQVKSTRRTFKALGVLTTGSRVPMRAEEAKELRTTMATLNDAQLRLEAIVREIDQSDLFDKRDLIMQKLRTAEDYINKNVLDLWEAIGGDVWEGADPNVYVKLRLREFVGDGFKKNVRIQLDELTEEMHKELFG